MSAHDILLQGINLTLGSNWDTDVTVYLGFQPIQLVDQSATRAWILPPDEVTENFSSLADVVNISVYECSSSGGELNPSIANLSNTYVLQVSEMKRMC